MMFKFELSSLMYIIILVLKPYSSKRFINFFANACFIISKVSIKTRVTCFNIGLGLGFKVGSL